MKFTPLPLEGAYLIDLEKIEDERGFFARQFCDREFSEMGLNTDWVQMNVALNRTIGTVRGMHFQRPPHAEIKMIRCLKGAIKDFIVDLRLDSPSYGKWMDVDLNDQNRTTLYVPAGFAHGYQSLEPDTEHMYFHSTHYSPGVEDGVRFDDPTLNIDWPLDPVNLSRRDLDLPLFADCAPVDLTAT